MLEKQFLISSVREHRVVTVIVLLAGLLMTGCATDQMQQDSQARITDFDSSAMCRGCHGNIVDQHEESMHAKAFSNPVFQAQYFRELLPLVQGDADLGKEADRCIACHAPVAFMKNKGHITSPQQVDPKLSGVVCDLCHRIEGFKGIRPGGGNYISTPGERKFGPIRHSEKWHHVYNELQTKSEFCGICHNDVNHNGLEIKSTFAEWKNSVYAERKINCQDCHMNLLGFLSDGKAVFEAGQAAIMTLGPNYKRSKLHTHKFPGAHSKTQIEGALTIGLGLDRTEAAPGEEVALDVHVFNKKVGHSIPSGSAELRILWVELVADVDGKMIHIPVDSSSGEEMYDIAGRGVYDKEILGRDVPEGSRVYRSIFVDKDGKQTLSAYNAAKIVFDNRLKAEEQRSERYHFRVPEDAKGPVTFSARINYLRYPSAFAAALNIEKIEPVSLAGITQELKIK